MLKDFLSFDKMMTPIIIKIVYYILLVLVILGALGTIIQGANAPYGGGGIVISGLLMLVLGPIGVRLYCELMILFFKIYEKLNAIHDEMKKNKE